MKLNNKLIVYYDNKTGTIGSIAMGKTEQEYSSYIELLEILVKEIRGLDKVIELDIGILNIIDLN